MLINHIQKHWASLNWITIHFLQHHTHCYKALMVTWYNLNHRAIFGRHSTVILFILLQLPLTILLDVLLLLLPIVIIIIISIIWKWGLHCFQYKHGGKEKEGQLPLLLRPAAADSKYRTLMLSGGSHSSNRSLSESTKTYVNHYKNRSDPSFITIMEGTNLEGIIPFIAFPLANKKTYCM